MDKSADAFRTISEVAEHLETPAHVLRFWESRFPQIKPVKRAGGRRYYRPSDVALLTGIKRLLHDEGMTIRGVQKILREQGVRHVSGLIGEGSENDLEDDLAPDNDDADENSAAIVAEAEVLRPVPGFASVMAKAANLTGVAETSAAHVIAPPPLFVGQGSLLLTPIPKLEKQADADGQLADVAGEPAMGVVESQRIRDAGDVSADGARDVPGTERVEVAQAASAMADFGEDDFEDEPTATLASRIRSLPPGASAAKVGGELLGVVARLQALRDAMADAAVTGRA